MSAKKPTFDPELDRVVKLTEASRLTSLSKDSLKRNYREYIVPLSPKRTGMKIRHILKINAGTAA